MGISTDTDVESGHQVGQMRATLAGLRRRQWLLALFVHVAVSTGVLLSGLTALSILSAALPSGPAWTGLLITLWGILLLGVVAFATARLVRKRADDQAIVRQIEKELPDFEQRILTSMEFSSTDDLDARGVSRRFVEKLWEDTGEQLKQRQELIQRHVSDSRAPLLVAGMGGALSLALMMSLLSVEFLRQGAGRIVWPFAGQAAPELASDTTPAKPVNLVVEPGAIRLQRGDPANISVRIENAIPVEVTLWVQGDQVNWRELPMNEQGAGSESAVYAYQLSSVDDDLRYYISADFSAGVADRAQSQEFDISVFDLPRAEQIDLAFHYPAYTGQTDDMAEDTGDALVPEGTEVAMQLQFNKPVASAFLRFEDGREMPVTVDGDTGEVSFTAETDLSYQVYARDFEQLQSEDPDPWYIRVIPDMPPELALISPGRDQDVMPLEEVVLAIDASDDYGLTGFDLHYSVVGSEEQRVNFLPEPGVQNVSGNQLVYLEDLQVQPGDFVSYYLTLADNNGLSGPQEVVSDIYFLQVVPTDQVFRESAGGGQQGGGGMGGNDSSSALVTLQKDIIAATWRLRQQQADLSADQFSDDVAVVATSQREAMERASMSIDRLSERLNFADDSYGNAVTYLQRAIAQMEQAASDLDGEALTSAMVPEQQALQYVLRAEAEINETDVNFQRSAGGGGGGGQQQEQEDLRELFDMEMGQNENRYENPRQAGRSQQDSEEASRLEQLARRQEGLSQAQRNLSRRMEQMTEEERRRELERLRREQEQLTQELAQLEQQMSRRRQAQGSQPGQQSSPANSQGGQSDGLAQVRQALQQMQEAAEAATPSQAAARSQRAADSLRQQQQQLANESEQSGNQLVQSLAERAEALQQQQQNLQRELADLNRQQGVGQSRQSSMNNEAVQQLLSERQRQQQELESLEEMLRAVIARAGNDEQNLIRQAQDANRAIRTLEERMQASGRVLRNGMVNLAVDVEEEVAESMQSLGEQIQGLQPGASQSGQSAGQTALQQVAGDASELREQLEALREALQSNAQSGSPGQPGEQGGESIADMREQLARSQQLAQQVREQLDPQGQSQGQGQQPGNTSQRGQLASQSRSQSANNQAGTNQSGNNQTGSTNTGQQARNGVVEGNGMRQQEWQGPQFGDAALWGNARSVSDEISQQRIEDFLNQPELLESILTPLVELESQLRAAAELSAVSQRLFNVAEEDIPERYRDQIEDYYRALSENGGSTQ